MPAGGLYPATRTFAELRRAVTRSFGDEAGVQLESQDIIDFANQGQTEIVVENAILKTRSTASSVIGQSEYAFPDMAIARVESITYGGRLLPNIPFQDAQAKLLEIDAEQVQEGTPVWWYSYGNSFWLWPRPTSSETIEVFHVAMPEKLTGSESQVLSVPDKWFNALVDYVVQRAFEMDNDWEAAGRKAEQFQAALRSQSEEESQSQWAAFPVVREV